MMDNNSSFDGNLINNNVTIKGTLKDGDMFFITRFIVYQNVHLWCKICSRFVLDSSSLQSILPSILASNVIVFAKASIEKFFVLLNTVALMKYSPALTAVADTMGHYVHGF